MVEEKLFWCILLGNRPIQPFFVKNRLDDMIIDLLMNIKSTAANSDLGTCDAHDILLYKLTQSIPIDPSNNLYQRIQDMGNIQTFSTQMDNMVASLSDVFPDGVDERTLRFLIKLPQSPESPPLKRRRLASPFPDPPRNAVERSDTVSAIYQKLLLHRFIHVRGTPASGKSTLAKLLGQHIRVQEPDVDVIWAGLWQLDDVVKYGGWDSYLKMRRGWNQDKDTVFIFDEAQESYKDGELWTELFKGIHDYPDRRAIAFASYGSPSSPFDIQGTPIFVPLAARVSLLPTAHDDDLPAAGLLFTSAEFNELVLKLYPESEYHFHRSFLDMVFEITNGHVGAIYSFLHIILGSEPYRKLKHSGQHYTWELFQETAGLDWFLHQLDTAGGGVFRRGLPSDGQLRELPVAFVFSSVLRTGSVQDTDFTAENNHKALHQCFSKGWLHTDNIDDKTEYFFPSSLHRWYIEWKLFGILDTSFQADNILDFVIDVIAKFSPRVLSTTRRVTTAGYVQRLPEAQYQDEFYRCCHTHTNGSLVTFPEFGTAKGRVDFYIPTKKWGVELLRNGDQLAQHAGRFSPETGSYGTTLYLEDYIVLDCRTTQPKAHHPHLQKLYHIVFDDGFSQVKILDNKLRVVPRGEFMLLASS